MVQGQQVCVLVAHLILVRGEEGVRRRYLSHLGSSFNGLVFGRFFLCNMRQGGLNKQPEPRRGAMPSVK